MKAFLQYVNAFLRYSALSDLQRGRELPSCKTLPADSWSWQQRGLAASGRDLAVGDEPARALANCLRLLVPPALEKGLRAPCAQRDTLSVSKRVTLPASGMFLMLLDARWWDGTCSTMVNRRSGLAVHCSITVSNMY
jgi:hypothetical protein